MFGFDALLKVPIMCECEIDDLECGSMLEISGPNCLNNAPFMHMMFGCNLTRHVQDKKETREFNYKKNKFNYKLVRKSINFQSALIILNLRGWYHINQTH